MATTVLAHSKRDITLEIRDRGVVVEVNGQRIDFDDEVPAALFYVVADRYPHTATYADINQRVLKPRGISR